MPLIMDQLGDGYSYSKHYRFDLDLLKSLELFNYFNIYESEEHVKVKLKDRQFEFGELSLIHKKASSLNEDVAQSSQDAVFKGILFKLNLNKSVDTPILILHKRIVNFVKKHKWLSGEMPGTISDTTNEAFNATYRMLTKGSDSASLADKNMFLDKIVSFNKQCKMFGLSNADVEFSIRGKHLFAAIPSYSGLFNTKLNQSLASASYIKDQVDKLNALISLGKSF